MFKGAAEAKPQVGKCIELISAMITGSSEARGMVHLQGRTLLYCSCEKGTGWRALYVIVSAKGESVHVFVGPCQLAKKNPKRQDILNYSHPDIMGWWSETTVGSLEAAVLE